MASTTFSDGQSIIYSSWLNDVNTAVYTGVFPNGTLSLTNLSVSGSVSGSGFTTLVNNTLSAPGAIGSVTANSGAFTTLTSSTGIAVSSGGTGVKTLTSNAVLVGNGTGAITSVSPSTVGNVLTSNGTTWQSVAPTVSGIAKAWAVWDGPSGTNLNSFNVSSITRNSTGNYTISYITALPSAYSSYAGTAGADSSNGQVGVWTYSAPTTTSVTLATGYYGTVQDRTQAYFVVFSK